MATVCDNFPNYELITEWDVEHREFYDGIPDSVLYHWLRSDVIRFEYLAEYKNILYLDWDVSIIEKPELNGLTWALRNDYWAVYNGEDTLIFKSILECGIKNVMERSARSADKNILWRKVRRNWLIPYIHEHKGNNFSEKCMRHK